MHRTLAIILLSALTAPRQANKTVWDGSYTAAQATRGQAAYTTNCSGCHGEDLAGRNAAKPLKGVEFMERWREYDLEPVFTLIKNNMPPRTARLSDDTYLDILSYILQGNGFPAGAGELKFEALEHIFVVGKDGPKPVPDGSLVRVVGCLVQRSETNWMLIDATEPIREKVADKTFPEELKRSQAIPAGNLRFRLVNFDYIAQDFRPDPYNGQRVQTKGYLIRQPNAERINLTSLERVATTCP
ncbi:MAG TPA: c-type cytochrome [Terriglobia bacterium]|nr:c-type cytochrome [Terriglobia bacterium]